MTEYAEEVYWLALIQESGLKLNLVKPMLMRWCVQEQRPLAQLFEMSALELSATFGLSEGDTERVQAVRGQVEAQAAALNRRQAQGLTPIIRTDPLYPRRLLNLSLAMQPLLLWIRGNAQLLNQPGVTMLGQSGQNNQFITGLIESLESNDIGLISGYSRGLDRETVELMLDTPGGVTLAMLPMGLAAFAKTTNRLDEAVQAGRTVLVSPFPPDTAYNDKLAEARNMLIDHLALALLIPDSDDDSQPRALSALERGLPVFVKEDTDANRQLLNSGALLLTDAGEVIDWVQQAIVDDALQEADDIGDANEDFEPLAAEPAAPPESLEVAAAPLIATAPTEPTPSDEDYSLRTEEAPPIDSEEAIEILTMGGEIPPVLLNRLKNRADAADDENETE